MFQHHCGKDYLALIELSLPLAQRSGDWSCVDIFIVFVSYSSNLFVFFLPQYHIVLITVAVLEDLKLGGVGPVTSSFLLQCIWGLFPLNIKLVGKHKIICWSF